MKIIKMLNSGWKLIGIVLLMQSLNTSAQVNQNYTIEGKTTKFSNVKVTYRLNGNIIENTAKIENGILNISGKVPAKIHADLLLIPDDTSKISPGKPKPMASQFGFWLEPGRILVNNIDSGKLMISGTPLNNDVITLNNQLKGIKQQFENWTKKNGYFLNDTSIAYKKKFYEEAKKEKNETSAIFIDFIKSHPNSLISLEQLYFNLSSGVPEISVVEPLFNGLSAEVKQSSMGIEYKARLAGWKNVGIGSVAPDFTQPDQNGKPVKLSDFKGKYVLLDFWASWCHPCRDGHPNLISQYNRYKNKNFIILSLSLDGNGFGTRESWLKAIDDDHIKDWVQVCDLTGDKKNPVQKLYGVGSIPQNLLIDPDGKIIGKDLHGEELNKKLKELFNPGQTD